MSSCGKIAPAKTRLQTRIGSSQDKTFGLITFTTQIVNFLFLGNPVVILTDWLPGLIKARMGSGPDAARSVGLSLLGQTEGL
jgi:hypothetical protein